MVNEYDDLIQEESGQSAQNQGQEQKPIVENEYDSLIRSDSQQDEVGLRESMRVASKADPQRHSEVYRLARETKLPTRSVEKNLDKVRIHQEQRKMDYKNLLEVTPGLSKWLKNPDNSKLAKNEIDPLKKMDMSSRLIAPNKREDRFTKQLDKAFETGYQGVKSAGAALALAYGIGDQREVAEFMANSNKRTNELYELAPSYIKKFRKEVDKESAELDTAVDSVVDAVDLAIDGDPRKGDLFKALMQINKGTLETVGEAFDLFKTYISNPRGTIYQSAESFANSVPAMGAGIAGAKAGAAAGSVIPGVGTVSGGIAGFGLGTFAGSVPVEVGAWVNGKISEKGYDTTDPDSIMEAFKDKAFVNEILAEATRKGVTTAAVDGVINAFGGKFLKGAKDKGVASSVKAGAQELSTQMAGESISEGAGQFAAEGKVSVSESLSEGFTSMGTSIVDVAVGANNLAREKFSKDPTVAIEEVVKETEKAMESLQEIQELENIGLAVKEAKNTSSVPGVIRELIETANEGEEASQVFFQTDDFDSYWNKKGESPLQKANEISQEVGEAYNQAKLTGEAFSVPLGEYAEKIGPTEDFEGMLNITRTKQDGMTLDEASAHMKELPGVMKSVAKEAESLTNQEREAQISEVKSNIKNQLREAGFSSKDAEIQASLYEARIKTRSDILNKDPMEVFNDKEIKIKRLNQNIVKRNDTFKDLKNKRKEREKNENLKATEINKLPEELRIEAESLIDAQISNMITEIENSEAGQRNYQGYGTDLKVTGTKSTFPIYYKSINAKNKEDFKKIANSKKGRRYNRIKEIAIERLTNGYESNEDGLVMPDNDFRALRGMDLIDESTGQKVDEFTLFQKKEQVKDLFVAHNLSEDNLKHAFKMGGLAVPSVAVTKKNAPMEGFGDITLVASPEMLKSKGAKTFNADIYSPRYPEVEIEIKDGFVENLLEDFDKEILDKESVKDYDIQDELERGSFKGSHNSSVLFALREGKEFDSRSEYRKFANENSEKFNDFTDSVISDSIEKEKLLKGFTKSGNRSYTEHTLDNVVKFMKKGLRDGEGFNYGVGSIRSTVAKQFKSIKDIQNNRDKVTSKENFEKFREEVNDEFSELFEKIKENEEASEFFEGIGFGALDTFSEHLKEVAQGNINSIDNYYKLDNSAKQNIVDFLDKLKNMPTEYFEAKIQRAVNVNEFQAAIVPRETSKEVIDGLRNQGLDVIEYGEDERARVTEQYLDSRSEKVLFQSEFRVEEGFALKSNETIQSRLSLPSKIDKVKIPRLRNNPRSAAQAKINIKNKLQENLNKDLNNSHLNSNPSKNKLSIRLSEKFLENYIDNAYDKYKSLLKTDKGRANKILRYELAVANSIPSIINKGIYTSNREKNPVFYSVATIDNRDVTVRFETDVKKVDGRIVNEISKIEVVEPRKTPGKATTTPDIQKEPVNNLGERSQDSLSISEFQDQVNASRRNTFFQDDPSNARGRINIGNDSFTIELLSNADPSTFIHESGHLFLEELRADFVEIKKSDIQNEKTEQFLKDAETILEFLEVESFADIETVHHEKWARAFESYLGEGKAPTPELQSAFNKFRTWIISVYRNLMNLNVKLTDDVRSVMDRMLATQEEISVAARETGARGLFEDARAMGMNELMAKRYEKVWQDWRREAEEKMTSDLVGKWQKEDKKFLDEMRKKEREKVADMVSEDPVYLAIDELQKGLSEDGTPIKLNRKEIQDLFGPYIFDRLPKNIYSEKESYSANFVAGVFGFKDGNEMINAMKDIPTKKEYIDQLTEKKLREKYSDRFLDQADLKERAVDAIHSDQRADLILMDLKHLASKDITLLKEVIRKVTKRPPSKKQIKAQAKKIVGELKLGNIRPYTYQLAEARNAKLAGEALAKGDLQAAFDFKEKELINHEIYRESKNALELRDKANKKFKKAMQKDEKLAKSRDMDMVNAARSILAKYGLIKPTGNENQNLNLIREYDPDAYETIKALIDSIDIKPKAAKELTIEEFSLIKDTFDALWDLSRESRMIEIDGDKIDIMVATEELVQASDKFKKPSEAKKYRETITDAQKFKNDLLGIKALVRRFEGWIDVMDSGDVSGKFRKFLFTPISEGTDKFLLAKKKIVSEIVQESREINNFDPKKSIESDELGFKFKNKGQLLGALLHVGNESNFKKLLVGYEWGSIREDGSLDTGKWDAFIDRMHQEEVLTKKDYDFIQSLWDKMESIKPDTQKAHKKLFGFYFNEITSNSFTTPFGAYKGGYAPAKIDPNEVTDIARKQELEQFIKGHQSYTYPASGGKGFTKSREENFNKPLNLDLSLVASHIEETLRFTYVKPAVVDAAKIIMRPEIKAQLNEIDPNLIEKLIKPALNRADKNAIQNRDPSETAALGNAMRFLKSRSSMQIMFANLVNTVEQFSGLGLSATLISPKKLALATHTYMTKPKEVAEFVAEKSDFMKARQDEQMFEMDREVRQIFDEKTKYGKLKDFAKKHTYFMQSFTQNIVDNITWQASYNESIEKGINEKQAIRKADADVRTTQSSRRPLDVSNIESNDWFGFFNMFQNFFLMMLNLNVNNFTNLVNSEMSIKDKYKKGLYLYTMGFMQVAIIGALLRKGAGGSLDEDDDGEYTDDLFDVFIGSQVDLGLAMIPIAGGAINAGLNRLNNKAYDDRVNASPAISAISTVVGTIPELIKTVDSNRSPKYVVRDGLNALGIISGLPLYWISRPTGYVIDVNRGDKRPDGPMDFTRGFITGK